LRLILGDQLDVPTLKEVVGFVLAVKPLRVHNPGEVVRRRKHVKTLIQRPNKLHLDYFYIGGG